MTAAGVVTPRLAADAYARTAGATAASGGGFAAALGDAAKAAVAEGHAAEAEAQSVLSGGGDITGLVTALSHAQLTLQTATAIRDRVLQAYQDIMRMPI